MEQDIVKLTRRLIFEYRSLAVTYFLGGLAMLISSFSCKEAKILSIPGVITFTIGALALIFLARITGKFTAAQGK
jgi:hypothetical protein